MPASSAPGPLVTCVIPVHDGEAYLAQALDSVLAQTHRPIEIIVVDNGSTDASADLAESYGPPVRVIRQPDLGPPGGRNTGIRAATGQYIAFLDADDLFVEDKLERQLARFAARPELDLSLGQAENFWEPGLEQEEAVYRAHGKVYAAYVFGTLLARREVFDRVGLIDASKTYGDQVEWFARVADAGLTVEVLDEVLMRRRMHRASLSHAAHDLGAYLDIVKQRLDRRRGRSS